MSFPLGAGARLPRVLRHPRADLDHIERQHFGIPGDNLGEPMHHDLALSQPRGCPLAPNEPVGQEHLDDLHDGLWWRQEVDIDRCPRVRVNRHRDAPADRVRNPSAAEGAHDRSKFLEQVRHAGLGGR